jgi:hypothetical protein
MPPHCAEDYPAYLTITNGFTADTVDASPFLPWIFLRSLCSFAAIPVCLTFAALRLCVRFFEPSI